MSTIYNYLYALRNKDITAYIPKIKTEIADFFPDINSENDFTIGAFVMHWPSKSYIYSYTKHKVEGLDDINVDLNFDLLMSKMHPVDHQLTITKVIPYIYNYIAKIDPEDLENWYFLVNYRIFDGTSYQWFISKCMIISNDNRELTFTFGRMFIIPAIFPKDTLVFIAYHQTENGLEEHTALFKPDEKFSLSEREKQILSYIKKGYNSQKIANTLFLSLYTVKNHRKNMLDKSGCKNISELVSYAIENNYIND